MWSLRAVEVLSAGASFGAIGFGAGYVSTNNYFRDLEQRVERSLSELRGEIADGIADENGSRSHQKNSLFADMIAEDVCSRLANEPTHGSWHVNVVYKDAGAGNFLLRLVDRGWGAPRVQIVQPSTPNWALSTLKHLAYNDAQNKAAAQGEDSTTPNDDTEAKEATSYREYFNEKLSQLRQSQDPGGVSRSMLESVVLSQELAKDILSVCFSRVNSRRLSRRDLPIVVVDDVDAESKEAHGGLDKSLQNFLTELPNAVRDSFCVRRIDDCSLLSKSCVHT